jgi:hypothetical protein
MVLDFKALNQDWASSAYTLAAPCSCVVTPLFRRSHAAAPNKMNCPDKPGKKGR